ncbi:MAG: hypothetical protein F4164_13215 [Gemmatimonadales bacterium]|nr:hypothetical protein [Gemmatimonadales bacterium]MYG50292.1 hypothetical protein [Gemmatimonadales bacterium]MYK03148.1 hypothetical protein [Candidatus Palauibacter ramosifaciens]
MSRRTSCGLLGLAAGIVAGWPAEVAAQRPDDTAAARPQETVALDMASEDWATAEGALREALRIPRAERGPALRSAMIAALEAQGVGLDRRGVSAPSYEALADYVGVLLEEVRAMGDPAAIPALVRSPAFGIREAVALADLGPAAMPQALQVATSPESGGHLVADGLLALRVMVEVWGGPEALPRDRYRELVDAAALYLDGPGERYAELTSSSMWRIGAVLGWAIDLAGVLGDPGLRARLEEIAADRAVTRALGVTEEDPIPVLDLQARAAAALAGEPPNPRPESVRPGGAFYRNGRDPRGRSRRTLPGGVGIAG